MSTQTDDARGVETPPSIVSFLADRANLLTLSGVASSVLAMTFALRGNHAAAGIALVAAFLFDLVDGPVAKRTPGRTAVQGAFGANLDSLADMLAAGAALGVVLLTYGHFAVGYVLVAVLLAAATALRLSYFNVYGVDESSGSYTGLPTDLAVMGFTALMLLDGPLDHATLRITLALGALVLGLLMISPVRIPKQTGAWYVANVVAAFVIAAVFAARLIA